MLRHRPATVEERARCGRFSLLNDSAERAHVVPQKRAWRAHAARTAASGGLGQRASMGVFCAGAGNRPLGLTCCRAFSENWGCGMEFRRPAAAFLLRRPSCCVGAGRMESSRGPDGRSPEVRHPERVGAKRAWLAMWGKALHAAWLRACHNGGAGRCCTSARGFTRPTRTHVSRASAGARKYWRSPFGGPGRPHRRGFARPAARERRRWRQQCGRGRRARWRRAWWRPAARRDESACAKRRPGDAARPLPRVQRGAAHHAREPAGCDVSAQPAVRQQAPLLRGAPQSGSVRSGGRGGKILPEV